MTLAESVSRRDTSRQSVFSVSGSAVAVSSSLIGRSEELQRLDAAFDMAVGGRSLAILIGGDAGVGKSRIVEEFCDRVRLKGAAVATGFCLPTDGALPYAPVLGILRGLGRRLDEPQSGSAGEFAKTVFFETVLQHVVERAEQSPVVIVFEDLHWVDSASSQLFDFLTRNLGDARVLLLGTYRSDDLQQGHPLTPWLAEWTRHPRVSELGIGPLDRTELASFIADHLGKRPTPSLVESVWTRSLGNPFFAEELLAGGDAATLPTALAAVISTRVRQLPERVQRLVELASAAGAVADHRLLQTLSGLDDLALDNSLTEAIDKKILQVGDSGESAYRFRHALLREAVYEGLLPPARRRLHRAVAVALTEDGSLGPITPGHRVAELASHWWAAGDWAQALEPSLQAADAAISMLAFPEALMFLERALQAAQRVPEAAAAAGVTKAQMLEKASDTAYLAGPSARAVELAQAAIEAIDHVADPVAAARCLTLLGRNMWGVGDSEAAFDAYRQAIELLPADVPSVELARLLAEEARGHMLMSRYGMGQARAAEAIMAAREAGSRAVEGHALNTLGCCRGGLGFFDEAIRGIQESLIIAEELASPEDLNRAYSNLTSMFLESGRLEETVAIMFDSAAMGEELWGVRLNGASGNGVEALVRLGRYADAEEVLGQLGTHALGVCAPSPWTLPSPIMIRRGSFEAAAHMIATAKEMTARLEDVQQAAGVLGLAAELDLERDRPQEALAHLEQAFVLTARSDDETLLPELCAWAVRALADQREAERSQGLPADPRIWRRADEILAVVQGVIEVREHRGAQPTPRTLAASAQASAERSRLDRSDPTLWARAATGWEAAREPYVQAYCRWREAEALLEGRAGRVRAAASLDQAWQISQDLGAEPLAARIVSLAQRGRLELQVGTPDPPSTQAQAATALGLTAREVEVLAQLAAGRSDREIAAELFISKKTVSVHVSNVLCKLDVARRVQAGKIGQLHGLGELAQSAP